MQEIANITSLIEDIQNYDGYDDKLSNRQIAKIQPNLIKIKEELRNIVLKFNGVRLEMAEQLKNKILEIEQQAKAKLETSIKDAAEKSYTAAYEQIGKEFANKIRCTKCGNNKVLIKHDYRADVLDCSCTICGFEWDKNCLDKKQ